MVFDGQKLESIPELIMRINAHSEQAKAGQIGGDLPRLQSKMGLPLTADKRVSECLRSREFVFKAILPQTKNRKRGVEEAMSH